MGRYTMSILHYYKGEEMLWFRLFGYGLSFNKTMKFSQRYRYSKYLKIGPWIISTLEPNN